MIRYLLHFDPPYWDLLEASEDPDAFDDDYIDENYCCIAAGDTIVVDAEGFERVKRKYPQERFQNNEP
jgi:hypothetical protein